MDEEEFNGFPEIDSIVMGAAHSIIMGYKPDVITPEMMENKVKKDLIDTTAFGLFDNATPNYATYYPDLNPGDLEPKDAEFIEPLFRMLSKTVVHRHFNPIDFSKGNVLRNSMNLLIGQAINIDHETAIGNAIGAVKSVEWQAAYKAADGSTVPAGFNAVLKIDGKSNPRIARGIMMDPPSIHSNSVTVRFRWEPSHPKMDTSEFYSKLGSHDENGELIRRIVTEIISYSETSLVAHGADPYAQVIRDGKINNPKFADIQSSLAALKMEAADIQRFFIDYTEDVVSNSATESATLKINNNNQNQLQMKKELLELLASVIGLADDAELTEDNISDVLKEQFEAKSTEASDALTAKETAEDKVTELESTVSNLETEKSDLETQVTDLTANAGIGETALTESREEATRLYKLSVGEDKVDAAILGVIDKADYNTIQSLSKQYGLIVDEKFELKCNDCNSTDVNRMSAKVGEQGGAGGGTTNISNEDVRDSLANKKRKPNPITEADSVE